MATRGGGSKLSSVLCALLFFWRQKCASGGLLGRSWRLLGSFWASPPLPGGLREVILGGFLRPLERGLGKSCFRECFLFFCVCFSVNLWLVVGLCCLPSCASGEDANIEKTLKTIGFCGSEAMWPFCGQRAKRRKLRANASQKWKQKPWKEHPPGEPNNTLKIIIFGAKIDAKMDPGGSRNVSVGRWAT